MERRGRLDALFWPPQAGHSRAYTETYTQGGGIIFFKRRKDSSVGNHFHLGPSLGLLDRQPGFEPSLGTCYMMLLCLLFV